MSLLNCWELFRIPAGENSHHPAPFQFSNNKAPGVTRRTENDDSISFGRAEEFAFDTSEPRGSVAALAGVCRAASLGGPERCRALWSFA